MPAAATGLEALASIIECHRSPLDLRESMRPGQLGLRRRPLALPILRRARQGRAAAARDRITLATRDLFGALSPMPRQALAQRVAVSRMRPRERRLSVRDPARSGHLRPMCQRGVSCL